MILTWTHSCLKNRKQCIITEIPGLSPTKMLIPQQWLTKCNNNNNNDNNNNDNNNNEFISAWNSFYMKLALLPKIIYTKKKYREIIRYREMRYREIIS